ncbi:exonuclease V-like [Diadema antillarum]|uniref:exonuclease V-like n=1 Tax=Diadema antillarum TaxID=105358 RepID=UPI003A8B0E3E
MSQVSEPPTETPVILLSTEIARVSCRRIEPTSDSEQERCAQMETTATENSTSEEAAAAAVGQASDNGAALNPAVVANSVQRNAHSHAAGNTSSAQGDESFGNDWHDCDDEEPYLHQLMDNLENTEHGEKLANESSLAPGRNRTDQHPPESDADVGVVDDFSFLWKGDPDKTPLQLLKGTYLSVTDLTSQAWCERKMVYDSSPEGQLVLALLETADRQEAMKMEAIKVETMKVGSNIHLKRELEVHTIKKVKAKTREDKWAIKFLNLFISVNQLLRGGGGEGGVASRCIVREIPICGRPFQNGPFVVGVIDEVRYNSHGQLEIVEFKTRANTRSIPSLAQRNKDKLQVMVYKELFDEAVCGLLMKDSIMEALRLDPDKPLHDDIIAHSLTVHLDATTVGDIVTAVLERFPFLAKIDSVSVEYSSQKDEAPFFVSEYEFDPVWLKDRLDHFSEFWDGRREPVGVDVEEAWKCNFCQYKEGCDWREKMHKKCLSRKLANHVQVELTE